MRARTFESGPLTFGLPAAVPSLQNWRTLFRSHFHLEVQQDRSLAGVLGAAPVSSWILARLAALLGHSEGSGNDWLTVEEDEARVWLEVREGAQTIAFLQVLIGPAESRLVGRMVRGDLETKIIDALKAALASERHQLSPVRATLLGASFGFDGARLIGCAPDECDSAELIDRLAGGEEVERLPDDREERCPVSRDAIVRDYLVAKPRVRGVPSVTYVQSAKVGTSSAWIFLIKHGRERVHALVRDERDGPVIEWVG